MFLRPLDICITSCARPLTFAFPHARARCRYRAALRPAPVYVAAAVPASELLRAQFARRAAPAGGGEGADAGAGARGTPSRRLSLAGRGGGDGRRPSDAGEGAEGAAGQGSSSANGAFLRAAEALGFVRDGTALPTAPRGPPGSTTAAPAEDHSMRHAAVAETRAREARERSRYLHAIAGHAEQSGIPTRAEQCCTPGPCAHSRRRRRRSAEGAADCTPTPFVVDRAPVAGAWLAECTSDAAATGAMERARAAGWKCSLAAGGADGACLLVLGPPRTGGDGGAPSCVWLDAAPDSTLAHVVCALESRLAAPPNTLLGRVHFASAALLPGRALQVRARGDMHARMRSSPIGLMYIPNAAAARRSTAAGVATASA